MTNQQPRFWQARLKREWANFHIDYLQIEWETFLKTDFCKIAIEDNPSGGQHLRITSTEPLPAQIILLIGDIVHNLRCALDYTISEILGWKDTRTTFPMGEDREELVTAFRTKPEIIGGKTAKKGRSAAIELTAPGICSVILDEIRPYKAGNEFLWPLGKLDGRDKHRLLAPVVNIQSINGINAINDDGSRMRNCGAGVNAGGTFIPFAFAGRGMKIESYGKPTADIFFNEAGIIENKRVFPTLIQTSQAVAETIDRIDTFLTDIGWVPAVTQ